MGANRWVVLLCFATLALVSYAVLNSCLWTDVNWTQREGRPSANIYGTSGRVHRLARTRRYGGPRLAEVSPGPLSTCGRFGNATGRRCDRWVVVTTIYPETEILRQIGALRGWCMVVVADKKGPASMDIPGAIYLDVGRQERCGYRACRLIPWNHFGRKNIGYLYAIEHGARWIYDTDDDNRPLQPSIATGLDQPRGLPVRLAGSLWNPYPEFGRKSGIWPRGFPLDRVRDNSTKRAAVVSSAAAAAAAGPTSEVTTGRVGVVQFLAQHDPDVDAIYRLTSELPYDFDVPAAPRRLVVPRGVLSPYNAQTTLHGRPALWSLLLPVTVHGRVSDIWRGYAAQRLLWEVGARLAFQSPGVEQRRNPHDYLADFDSETDLYYKAGNLARLLLAWTASGRSLQQGMLDLQIELYEHGFLEAGDVDLMRAWLHDLHCVGYQFPTLQER